VRAVGRREDPAPTGTAPPGFPSLRPGSLGRPGPREQVCSRRRLGVRCGQWVAGRTRLPHKQPHSTSLHCVQGRSAGLGRGCRSVRGGGWECSAGSGSPGGPGSHRNSPTPRSRLRQSCFAMASQDAGYGGQAAAGWATGSTPLHFVQGRSAGLGRGCRSVRGGGWECSAGSGSPGGPGSHRNSPTPRSRLRQSCFAMASQDEGYGGQAAAGWATGRVYPPVPLPSGPVRR
jgi:hypothetical protein